MILGSPVQLSCDEIGLDEVGGPERVREFVSTKLACAISDEARFITVDGFDGVGKSMLSRYLSEDIGVPLVGLDEFVEKQTGHFLEALRFGELSNRVAEYLDSCGRIIVEGCMVQAAVERIGRSPDFRIYVMRVTRMRNQPDVEWIHEHAVLCGEKSADELIAELEDEAQRWAKMPEEFGGGGEMEVPMLERELVQYHSDRCPHRQAGVLVKVFHY